MTLLRQEDTVVYGTVESDYHARLADLNRSLTATQKRRSTVLRSVAGCTLLLFVLWALAPHFRNAALALFPLLATVGVVYFVKSKRVSLQIALRSGFYERGLERLRLNWKALDRTGEEFARAGHLYQFDLQIIGERSLFSLLCTTRSQAGAARLAEYLLDPTNQPEVLARQSAVRELKPLTALRETIAMVGRYQFLECDHRVLCEWMSTPEIRVPWVVPALLFICSSTGLLLAILCFAGLLTWIDTWPVFVPLLITQASLCAPLLRSVRSRLKTLRTLTDEVSVLYDGLQLLQVQQFKSPKLKTLVEGLRMSNAPRKLGKLDRLLRGIAQRDKDFFALPSLLTASGTQLVLAVERWRNSNREQFVRWIEIWAEFDALLAIAGYAWEHPEQVFPDVTEGAASLQLQGVGHPLLPSDECVRNEVVFDRSRRFWILSGSNMAGKSTLLRAIGMNLVLASAGAPIRANSARFSHFAIGASISVSDSLLDGKSKFLAEVERLKQILKFSGEEQPVLFLIDEILSGTNSRDRCIACKTIVGALVAGGGIGILSTHDLALTEIADEPGLYGLNCCMESDNAEEPLQFDYVVKPGISRSSSAIAIIRMVGIDVAV